MTARRDTAFDELLAAIDVQDFLETEGVDYRKSSSGQLQVKDCPFCNDNRWKVYLRADNGRGKCFHGSCERGFNLFSFARAHWGTDNHATIVRFDAYARGAGHVTSAPVSSPAPITPGTWSLPSSTPLPTPEGATHPFLVSRRVTLATQALFGLRYCDQGDFPYVDHAGLSRTMSFADRVLIPVIDLDGEMKSFQGRDVTGDAEQRYLFPPMLPGTGRFLYGAHLARGKPHLVICEGPFDVMATHQAINGMEGFADTGVVGSFGLSIGHGNEQGDDQLGRLRTLKHEGLKRLTFLWDGEPGALKQALETGKRLKGEGFEVRIALLPQDKDPADVDTRVVRDAIQSAQVLSDATYFKLMFAGPYV